jgi:hypothetical protein
VRKIVRKNKPTRQHHVPQVYLKNFCDLQGCIAVMDKRKHRIFTTGARAVGAENDFYTLEKLDDPYCWERAYASGIEPLMGKLLTKLISQTHILLQSGATVISPSEKSQLAVIMVVQLLRGKQSREFERELYADHLPEVIDKAKTLYGSFNNEQKKLLEAFESDRYYFKRTIMDVTLDSDRVAKYAGILCSRDFLIYRIQGNMEFITSDNPVMFINSITNNARPFTNGLIKPTTLIYYPISPKLLLCAVHPLAYFGFLSTQDCHLIDLDACKEISFITTINEKQISQCYRHAFARSAGMMKQYQERKGE